MSLTQRARNLFPTRINAAKWVIAVRWMRSRSKNLWILEGGKLPSWGNKYNGGPAKIFEEIADRIRTGEKYHANWADYGITVREKK